jgi:ketosteroid isomerase-like protein
MSDEEDRRRTNLRVVEKAFAALGGDGMEEQLDAFTDDAVLELPYADPPLRLEGRDAIRDHVGPALNIFKFRLHIEAVYDCLDPDTLVLEYTSDGHVTTTGKPYRNSYVALVRFRGGAICFQREYYNPLLAIRALTPD